MSISFKILSLLADATSVPVPAPTEALPSYEGAFAKMFLTLLVLVVAIVGTVWFLKRLSRSRFGEGSSRSITILDKKAISPKTMLYVVEIEGKQALIAESQLEVRRIMELEPLPEEIEK